MTSTLMILVVLLPTPAARSQTSIRPDRCQEGPQVDTWGCPCECPKNDRPICGIDGVTYPNTCLACPTDIAYEGGCTDSAPTDFGPGGDFEEEPAHQPHPEDRDTPSGGFEVVSSPPTPPRNDNSEVGPTPSLPLETWHLVLDRLSPGLSIATTLVDWIEPTPGIDVVRTGRASVAYSLRGLTGRRTLLLQDGIRLNHSALAEGIHPTQGFVDLSGLSRVEIWRGPRSGLWGGDAMGGVVALSSRSPSLSEDGYTGSVSARFASAELERSGAVRAEGRVGPLSLLGGFSALQTSELRAGSPYGHQDRPGYTQLGGDARMTLRSRAGDFSLVYSGLRQLDLAEPDPTPGSPAQIEGRGRDFAWGGYHRETPVGGMTRADVKLAFVRQYRDFEEAVEGGLDSWRSGTENSGPTEEVRQFSLVADLVTPFGTRLNLQWGLEGNWEVVSLSGAQPEIPDSAALVDGSGTLTAAGWAAATLVVTSRLLLELDARLSLFRASVPETATTPAIRLMEIPVNAGLALRYQVTPYLSAHLGASNGTRFPGLRDVTTLQRQPEGTVLPNPDLSGEQIVGLNLGIRLDFESFAWEVVGFHQFLYDLMTVQPTGEFDPHHVDSTGAPLPYLMRFNLDEARISGVESLARLQLGKMQLYANLSWMWGQDVNSDQPLQGIPPLDGRFGITYRSDRWGIGPYCRFALAQHHNAEGEPETPGYAILGASGQVRIGEWGRVVAAVDNLADEGYRTHGSSFPEPGVNALVALEAQLP